MGWLQCLFELCIILRIGALLEMLREMKESNKKLQDDLKRLSEKIDSDESGATHKKNKKATPSPEIRVSDKNSFWNV